ncbi:hypothetical protein CONPUDRAFT_144325 [Coniophora puteana RWD-64-598 SS2]|uniref:Uncharacterized protein n=1 Tax=Coniophora puteana (strain RWD-64-598) TaxID=741705 RepID=A0A5M3MR56_CONPW|nr:uncharacterized protein CONPUDRAFT_144325 [Coniophora puteana RWD-64-598 SS2]EIW81639.1 hypothetical protein CONPUDRAFT_144325 [Coniophora puteana RWD-64-598 SS2]
MQDVPACLLPPELLQDIFVECMKLAHAENISWRYHVCHRNCLLDWVYVTHVCRYWRAAALASSQLWSHVVMVFPQWAEAMVERSKNHPLTVSWTDLTMTSTRAKEYSNLIVPNTQQFDELLFTGTADFVCILAGFMQSRGTSLRSLSCIAPIHQVARPLYFKFAAFRQLKKLNLMRVDMSFLENVSQVWSGMRALEELTLFGSFAWCDKLEEPVELPSLKYTHLRGVLRHIGRFLASIRTQSPLRYLAAESDRSVRYLPSGLPIVFRQLFVDNTLCGEIGKDKYPPDLSAYHCSLQITLETTDRHLPNPGAQVAPFQLTGWRRQCTNASEIISWAKEGSIPFLPQADRSHQPSGITELDDLKPAILFSGECAERDQDEIHIAVLSGLAQAFSLSSVVVLSLSEGPFLYWPDAIEAMHQFLRGMTSMQLLDVEGVHLGLITNSLMPRGSNVPAPRLTHLWLTNIDFYARSPFDLYADPAVTLSTCLASRGRSLSKLCISGCTNMDRQEKAKLQRMDVEVYISEADE